MKLLLFSSIILSFVFSFLVLPFWIKKTRQLGMVWEDMNKKEKPPVSASGGVVVIFSFIMGVLFYIAIQTFFIKSIDGLTIKIFSLVTMILIFALIGLIDDLFGWHHGGLSTRIRLFLLFFGSIPLVVINAGTSTINFPFLGTINIGLLYPLVFVPIGVAGATATFNFLAGFNGLEAGQGIIILSFLSFISYKTGSPWLSLIGLIMTASLIAFYFYNRFPAKVFPGDSLTWSVGAMIASMAILGNFEKIAVFIFIPYILETMLKLRGGLKKQSFAKVKSDGSLEMPYPRIYGTTHLAIFILKRIKKKVYEKDVVRLIFSFQLLLCLIALFVFRRSLFL